MSKKQRHKQSQKPAVRVNVAPAPAAAVPMAAVAASRPAPAAPKPKAGATWAELSGRYRHVNDELKQIGILAGSFLVVLLILWAILD